MFQASRYGKIAILKTVLGITLAQFVHISYSVYFGSSLPLLLTQALSVLGASYLFYIAYMTYVHRESELAESSEFGFKRGFLVNLFNGKVLFYFISIFPPLLIGTTKNDLTIIILSITIMVFGWFFLLGQISSLSLFQSIFQKYKTKLDTLFSLFFAILAVFLLQSVFQ